MLTAYTATFEAAGGPSAAPASSLQRTTPVAESKARKRPGSTATRQHSSPVASATAWAKPASPDEGAHLAELTTFRARISDAGHDSYGAWREGQHDDLVLAVALAAWWGETGPREVRLISGW